MSMFRLSRPSPALVISLIALIVAMGGTSYAAFRLPAGSVSTRQLANGAVSTAKIKNGAVNGSKVAPNSITGANINLGTLGKVPTAGTADTATSAAAAPIAKVQIITATGTSGASTGSGNVASATATCPQGTFVLGGGTHLADEVAQTTDDSYPSANNAWTANVFNGGTGTPTFTVYAICGPAAATG